jgi:hypothetical protein
MMDWFKQLAETKERRGRKLALTLDWNNDGLYSMEVTTDQDSGNVAVNIKHRYIGQEQQLPASRITFKDHRQLKLVTLHSETGAALVEAGRITFHVTLLTMIPCQTLKEYNESKETPATNKSKMEALSLLDGSPPA